MSDLTRKGREIINKRGILIFLKKTSNYLFWRCFGSIFFYFLYWFRGLRDNTFDVDTIVNFVFSFRYPGVSIIPLQIREEIMRLLKLVKKHKPRIILEIGTAHGGTLFLFTRIADPEAIIISIDLPGELFGGGYPMWKISLYRSFARAKQRICLFRADSHNFDTIKKVREILGGCEIDFLFIDGDHSYEGVKMDFEMYSPLVKKGGIIVFHDIVPHDKIFDPSGIVDVNRFWSEVRKNYKYLEIVKDWTQGWAGIGILYV